MNSSKFTIFVYLLILPFFLSAQQITKEKSNDKSWIQHPWQGKRVGFIGDSLTDPHSYGDKIKKYWSFLQEWLDIEPYVYGVSGRQWDNVPVQAQQLHKDHGNDVDAILVFMGTNDYNHGVPIGEWFAESSEQVMAAYGEPKKSVERKKRTPIMDKSTYRGRLNIGISQLKKLFPDKQIVLLTPLHRSLADFGEKNVQPDESYQNRCGEYVDVYIQEIKNAGNIWGIPVIDLNAVTGLNPMVEEQVQYFYDSGYDRLHPNTKGQERIAKSLLYQLIQYPCVFDYN